MLITTKCHCGKTNVSEVDFEWAKNGNTPVQCKSCNNLYIVNATNIEQPDEQETIAIITSKLQNIPVNPPNIVKYITFSIVVFSVIGFIDVMRFLFKYVSLILTSH